MQNAKMKFFATGVLLSGLVSYPAPSLAFGVCDLLSGDAGALCRAAAQAVKNKKRQADPEAIETPAAVSAPPKIGGKSKTAAQPENLNSYRGEKFYGISVWGDAFTKMVNDPSEFKKFLAGIVETAGGSSAKVYGLATGPQRNFYQKFLTDYQVYADSFRSPRDLMDKTKQCSVARDYTPAEACDCVAGFPGDTLIGAGAGELVTGSNSAIGIRACGKAADEATDPALKGRYLAQRARAQVYTFNTFQAVQWADEAIKLGYRRAAIVKASGALRDFEMRNSGFPPPSAQANKEIVDAGIGFLKESKRLGVHETYIVARQFRQSIAIYQFNTTVLTPIFREMMKPPPAEKAGGCRADGVPCQGERVDSSGNITSH